MDPIRYDVRVDDWVALVVSCETIALIYCLLRYMAVESYRLLPCSLRGIPYKGSVIPPLRTRPGVITLIGHPKGVCVL